MTSITPADAASALRLKIGDNVVALLKPSQATILRNQIQVSLLRFFTPPQRFLRPRFV
jgi:hypothetical protein